MLTRTMHVLQHLIWRYPDHVITGLAWLCLAGVLASASTSILIKHYPKTRTMVRAGPPLALPLSLFCLFDWLLLCALPLLKLSFSQAIGLPLIASVMVRLCFFWVLSGVVLLAQLQKRQQEKRLPPRFLARWQKHRRTIQMHTRFNAIFFLAFNLSFSLVQLDAYVVEPLWVETTTLSLAFESLSPDAPPVRIAHVTDTHIERSSYREASTVARINALQPDIIVLSGDYLNTSYATDPIAANDFRAFVAQLKAPHGIYAVRGTVERTPEYMSWLVQGSELIWLENQAHTVNVRGQLVTLIGVACSHNRTQDAVRLDKAMLDVPEGTLTVLLYHSPDLIHEAAQHHVDLILGGHTHGGQLRLPFYGAIVTSSVYGKRYEAGMARQGDTLMYISRGLGFEGGVMPRARFLCRPEIVRVELKSPTPQGL